MMTSYYIIIHLEYLLGTCCEDGPRIYKYSVWWSHLSPRRLAWIIRLLFNKCVVIDFLESSFSEKVMNESDNAEEPKSVLGESQGHLLLLVAFNSSLDYQFYSFLEDLLLHFHCPSVILAKGSGMSKKRKNLDVDASELHKKLNSVKDKWISKVRNDFFCDWWWFVHCCFI